MGDGPVGATWMSCCLLWEEDENTINYSAHDGEGYQHWQGDCRRSWSPGERQRAYQDWQEQQQRQRPEVTITVPVQTTMLRRADGLIWGVRMCSPKLFDSLYVLNRETDDLAELRPYRVSMFKGQR